MACSTRARVRSLTGRVPLTTCETVDVETLAKRATSTMVGTRLELLTVAAPPLARRQSPWTGRGWHLDSN
jgi:hypothetical protein